MSILLVALSSGVTLALGLYLLHAIRRMMNTGVAYVVLDVRRFLLTVKPAPRDQDPGRFWVAIALNAAFATGALAFFAGSLLIVLINISTLVLG